MADAKNRKVAILATDGVERVELTEPMKALRDAGAEVVVLSLKSGEIQAMDEDVKPSEKIRVDLEVSAAKPEAFDVLVLPGGTTNPDKLRQDESAVAFVKGFAHSGKPVAAICHAPWLLVSAGQVHGRRLTSFPSLTDDIRNAGGDWVDETVVVDDNLITSRNPEDIPAFNKALLGALADQTVPA